MGERRAGDRTFIVTIAAAFLLKLWLTSETRIVAAAAPHDNLNYIWHAKSIAMGLWFGAYDRYTLIKLPFFPIYMAGLQEFGIPLSTAHVIVYGFACFVACFAIAPLVRDGRARSAVFVVLYFNPMENNIGSWSSTRSQITGTLALLTLGCAIGLYLRRDRAPRAMRRWAYALGASLTALWLTREESIWVVPALLVLAAVYIVPAWRARDPALMRARIAAAAIPAVMCAAGIGIIMILNGIYYGWFTIGENVSPELVSAYNSLARIDPGVPTDRRFPVPKQARAIAYSVSPAARELQPSIEGARGNGWAGFGCQAFKACGDIHGGWFIWAFRDAVAEAGYYTSGAKTRSFYVRLADEIDAACAGRRIVCRNKSMSLAPPVRPGDIMPLIADMSDAFMQTLGFVQFAGDPPNYPPPPNVRIDYDFIVRSVDDGVTNEPAARDDDLKRAVLKEVAHTYQLVFPLGFLIALAAAIARTIAFIRKRSTEAAFDYVIVSASLIVAVFTLIGILALVDTLSFPSMNSEYMSPLFPLTILAVSLAISSEAPGALRFLIDRMPRAQG